uniref:CCHC-type domain-containing protein n=1 Tax=Tanacetum cinerariifolium TaxID=118510 RepID=A0A6L2KKR0_TANCI|nr:hypothetical protein [Tanacetum cinerariifolium]
MASGQGKPEGQWTRDERKAANLDQRLKSLFMSLLLDDQINSVINCLTAKSTWDGMILYHKGLSDVKQSRVMDLKLCYNTFIFIEDETLTQTLTRYKALINALDFQDNYDDEEDTKSSHEYMNNLEEEYQSRAILAKSKRFFKKDTQRFSSAKATDQTECHKCGKKGHLARDCLSKTSIPSYQSPFQLKSISFFQHKPELKFTKDFETKYKKLKAKLALLRSSVSARISSSGKNKGLIFETYEWDEEELSPDENEAIKVKALIVLANEGRVFVGKESASNGEWVNISIQKRTNLQCVAKPVSRPNTIKSILKSNSTFKAETLKGITLKEPSLAPDKNNRKGTSTLKTFSAPADKLKNVKIEDDPPLATWMKELNELKLQLSKNKSSYSRNHHSQQVLIFKGHWENKSHEKNSLRSLCFYVRVLLEMVRWIDVVSVLLNDIVVDVVCISEPFTKSPNMYKEYLAEFWYSAKALENSKVSFSIPTGGIYEEVAVNTFRNSIGAHYLPHSSEYVAPPSIDTVRPWVETIWYTEIVPAKRTLKKSILPPSVNNWALKPNQPEEPPFTDHMLAICAAAKPMLEDLAKLVPNVQSSFKDLNLPKDDTIIAVDDSDEDEDAKKDESVPKSSCLGSSQIQEITNQVLILEYQKHKVELEKKNGKAALKAQPFFPNMGQLNKLLVKSLQTEFLNILSAHDFSNSLPTKLKELPFNFNELTKELKGLKKQAKLKTLDALPSLLNKVTNALIQFAQSIASMKTKDESIPSTAQAGTQPAEGGKNTNQTTISQLFQRKAAKNANLTKQQSKPTPPPTTPIIPPKDKGKKAMSSEEVEKENTNSDSDNDKTHLTGSMVESSKIKKEKMFDFFTECGKHIYLIEEQINQQKNIEEDVKLEAAKRESEDFQDNYDDEDDTKSSHEYMNNLEEEYQSRAILAKSKRFFKKGKNKGLIVETYEWDEEELSPDENEAIKVKALMALANEERVSIGKESASNGEWVKISIQKEPSLAPDKNNIKGTSTLKTFLAPADKLKNVKIEDNPPLATGMKELNELKLQLSKNKSSYSRNHHSQQTTQHLTRQGESSSRSSQATRPVIPFPSCIHYGYNDHQSNECVYYPICELCGSYDLDTYSHNKIISLRRGIKPRNPQHVIKNNETCGNNVHTITNHNDIEWFRKREALKAQKARENTTIIKCSKIKDSH